MKIKISVNRHPSSFPLSDGIATESLIFVSGQIPIKDGKLVEGTIEEQAIQVMANLKTVLQAGGAGFEDVVKATVYVTDMSLYGRINDVYKKYFSDPFPARELVCVKELPAGASIEISVVAIRPKS